MPDEAQTKAGEILRLMAEKGERQERGRPEKISQPASLIVDSGQKPPAPEQTKPVTLRDLGLNKDEASRWQTVAAVPSEVRREYVETTKAEGGEVRGPTPLTPPARRASIRPPDPSIKS